MTQDPQNVGKLLRQSSQAPLPKPKTPAKITRRGQIAPVLWFCSFNRCSKDWPSAQVLAYADESGGGVVLSRAVTPEISRAWDVFIHREWRRVQ